MATRHEIRHMGFAALALPLCLAGFGHQQAHGADLKATPPPAVTATFRESLWTQQERRRFGDWLAKRPADVLVVPFQVAGHGLDPSERLLMATTLADHLSGTSVGSVADPVMVGRALGEGSRTYDDASVKALAGRMRAKLILIGAAGHDGQGKLSVSLRVLRQDSAASAWRNEGARKWDQLALRDVNPPYQAMAQLLPDIDSLVGAKRSNPARPVSTASFAPPGGLPRLQDMVSAGKLSNNVHVAQLVASAYPRFPEAPHERAWLQTLRVAHRDGFAKERLVIARALMHLGRRPAALAALGEPQTSAERALREILNANLPAAEQHARAITDPVLRLIAQIELRDLRLEYGAANKSIEKAALAKLLPKASDWDPFLQARVQGEGSVWGVEPTMQALVRFDELLQPNPSPLQELQSVLRELESDTAVESESGRLALASYETLVESDRDMEGGSSLSMRRLLVDLYQAQIVTDLMGEIYLTQDTRALLDDGHKLLDSLDPLLRGHADFEAAKARLAWYEYARWRGQQRAKWQELALSRSRDAYRWSNRLSRAMEFTERHAASTPDIAAALDPQRIDYFWDWPVTTSWVPSALRQDKRAMQWYADGVVAYEMSSFTTITWLAQQPLLADRTGALLQSVQGRFEGNPDLADYRAGALLERFDVKGAEQVYRNYVAARPMAETPYSWYAWLLISQGRHREAYDMIDAYPGFAKDSGANRVALASTAKYVGSMFWLAGRFDYGRPFLERSAGYDTGSAATMTSAAMLALDDGDPDAAAKMYMKLARRYSDLNSLDEYYALIFALGRPEEAWRVYKEVHKDGNGGKVIASVARGVRVLAWTDQQVIDWLAAPKNALLADGTFFYAPRAAFAASVMDRELPADLAGVVQLFKAPSPYAIDKNAQTIVRRADPAAVQSKSPAVCGPSRYAGGPAKGVAGMSRAESHLLYFAKGYQALDRGDHTAAFDVLDDAARTFEFFGHDCEDVSYMLPYLALAAAKVKDTAALQRYLDKTSFTDRATNYSLAMAVLAALDSQHKQADDYLETALNRWAWGRYNVLPAEYVYADIVERLYRLTKAQVYRERLVRWAKIRQRIAPAQSWAYAKEYLYANDAADRRRALGMLQYLDPLSSALKSAKAEERTAARAALDPINPFLAWRRKQAAASGQK